MRLWNAFGKLRLPVMASEPERPVTKTSTMSGSAEEFMYAGGRSIFEVEVALDGTRFPVITTPISGRAYTLSEVV